MQRYQEQLEFGLILEAIYWFWTYTQGLPSFLSLPIIILGLIVRDSDKPLYLMSLQSLCFLDLGFYGQLLFYVPNSIQINLLVTVSLIMAMKAIKVHALINLIIFITDNE